jgi:VanZ family protein
MANPIMIRFATAEQNSSSVGVSKVRSFLKHWLPAWVWMAVVFSASADTASMRHSSRILEPILRWLFPHLSEERKNFIIFLARKGAHLTEYAVLSLLFWRGIRKSSTHDSPPWSWGQSGQAVLYVAVFAATDEFHQLFVPGREASVHDVIIDTTGGILGILVFQAILAGWARFKKNR